MKIYNVFNFFNELDILELRLHELYPVVDYFIICECTVTHSGLPKPLYYLENKKRFDKYNDKIISHVIDDCPLEYDDLFHMTSKDIYHQKTLEHVRDIYNRDKGIPMSFLRDGYQKEQMMRAVALESKNITEDVVIIGDLDEVPRLESVCYVLDNFNPDIIYLLENTSLHFYFNLEKTNETWLGANIMTVESLINNSIADIKLYKIGKHIPNAGWHFSYMGGASAVIHKLESFSHQELNTPYIKNYVPYIIENCINKKADLLGRPSDWKIRDIYDGTYPVYLTNNTEKFKKYILEEKTV